MEVDGRELEEILREAEAIVSRAELPADLRVVAYGKVIDALAGPAPRGASDGSRGDKPPDTPLGKIAERLELTMQEVEEIYYLDDDGLGIGLSSTRLDPAKTVATKQLALIVAAGRQAGGFDAEWTSSSHIRKWCAEFARYDSSNYATTITEMGDLFQFRGSGQQREVRVRRLGFERAADNIRRLVSGQG